MNNHKSILLLLIILTALSLGGCYTDTVNSLSTFKFQIPIEFKPTYYYRTAPDTAIDFSNLERYKDYEDNKDRIKRADLYMFNYWIDSMIVNGYNYNPNDKSNRYYFDYTTMTGQNILQFNFIRYYLVFAKKSPYPVNNDPLDPRNWIIDPLSKWYLLGSFENANMATYWKMPDKIYTVNETTTQVLSEAIKTRPQFYIVTEYSKTTGGESFFDVIKSGFTMVLRFEAEL